MDHVLSDGDTRHSIFSDLHKRSVTSEKVLAAQMTSTQERGRSLLTVLELMEKLNKLREPIAVRMERSGKVRMESSGKVENVKSLAEEMTAQLSKSEQGT